MTAHVVTSYCKSLGCIVARYSFGTKNTVGVEVSCETCLQELFPYWGSTDQIRPEHGLKKLAGLLSAKIRSTVGRIIREIFWSETVSCFYARLSLRKAAQASLHAVAALSWVTTRICKPAAHTTSKAAV